MGGRHAEKAEGKSVETRHSLFLMEPCQIALGADIGGNLRLEALAEPLLGEVGAWLAEPWMREGGLDDLVLEDDCALDRAVGSCAIALTEVSAL